MQLGLHTKFRTILPLLAALTACGDGTVAPVPPDPGPPVATQSVQVAGTILTADRGPLPGLQVLAYSDADTATVLVDGEGRFNLVVDRPEDATLTVLVSEVNDDGEGYLASLKTFGPEDVSSDLVVMLIPSQFTVPSGRFAGQTVEMSLQAAVAPENQLHPEGNGSFYGIHRWITADPDATLEFAPGVDIDATRSLWTSAWNDTRLPLPLYFEHEGSNPQSQTRGPISAEDSTAIWSAIADLEDRLGLDLFDPAEKAGVLVDTLFRAEAPEPVRLWAVSLEMIPDLASPGVVAGFAGAEAGCRAFAGDACERFGPGELLFGKVTPSSFVGSPPDRVTWLVQHELVHSLGFGHACFRPSVMAACAGPYPGVSLEGGDPNPLATAFDAAYLHWYRMIHARTVEVRPHFGIVEALDGERTVRHRRAPVPTELRCQWGEFTEACFGPPPVGVARLP